MMPLDMATKFFGQPAGLPWLHDGYICDAFRCSHRFRKVTGCDRDSKPLQSLIGNKCYTMFRLVTWFLLPVNRLVAGSNPARGATSEQKCELQAAKFPLHDFHLTLQALLKVVSLIL